MIDETLAPILVFGYTRLKHMRMVLESLRNNKLADKSRLFVSIDGPANKKQKAQIDKVADLCMSENWCSEVNLIRQEQNLGTCQHMIDEITKICNRFGKVIVLEDDLLLSPDFLSYMNEALQKYEHEEKLMSICGFMPRIPINQGDQVYFMPFSIPWGWATWKRAWDKLDVDMKNLSELKSDPELRRKFDIDNGYPSVYLAELALANDIKAWDIRWHYTIVYNEGLSVFPARSLVNNIGFDGSGTHCGMTEAVAPYIPKTSKPVLPDEIQFSENAFKRAGKFYHFRQKYFPERPSATERALDAIRSFLPWRVYSKLKLGINKAELERQQEIKRLVKHPLRTPGTSSLPLPGTSFLDSQDFLARYRRIFVRNKFLFSARHTEPKIIECGSEMGLGALYFKSVFPDSRITIFEPEGKYLDVVKENLKAWNLDDIEVINKMASVDSKETFFIPSNPLREEQNISCTPLVEHLNGTIEMLRINISIDDFALLKNISSKLKDINNIFIRHPIVATKQPDIAVILSMLENSGFRFNIYTEAEFRHPFEGNSSSVNGESILNIFAYRDWNDL